MKLQDFFNSIALMVWSTLSLLAIVAIVGKSSVISTTNLLLILILGTLSFKMFIENASDVIESVTDAAKTVYNIITGGLQ